MNQTKVRKCAYGTFYHQLFIVTQCERILVSIYAFVIWIAVQSLISVKCEAPQLPVVGLYTVSILIKHTYVCTQVRDASASVGVACALKYIKIGVADRSLTISYYRPYAA